MPLIVKVLTVLALLFLATELFMALFVGGGLLLFRRGRFHEHDGYQPGFKTPDRLMVPDAIVMLSMGTSFRHTENPISAVLRACACSIRHRGGYTGDILIVTDQAAHLDGDDMLTRYNIRVIKVPPVENLSRIWFTKCMLLEIIPPVYRSIMYIDSDILVTARLEGFFSTIPVFPEGVIGMFNDITTRFGRTETSDTYHGGVVLMQRNASESCLAGWCSRMQKQLSPADRLQWGKGEVEDDQDAIKAVVELERTCRVWFIPDRFMQFMADWQTMVLAPSATFAHFTDSARKRLAGPSSWFWQWLTLSEARVGEQCLAEARTAYLHTPKRSF